LLSGIGIPFAQFTYPGCDSISESDFSVATLVDRSRDSLLKDPLKMDFHADANGVNVFFVERTGALKYYDAGTGTVRKLGTVPGVYTGSGSFGEDGLLGIALDPDFGRNRRVYLQFSALVKNLFSFRVSRFELDPATLAISPGSEKVILSWAGARDRYNTGGGMRFDTYGDLWIAVGDNLTLFPGPGNPADLRGSILRIHPREDGTYAIPAGNFWEGAAAHFDSAGRPEVAAKYRDSSLARREIYVKGVREPYTLTLDPVRRWAAWGDCGPDIGAGAEEQVVATSSGFHGWPFWVGESNAVFQGGSSHYAVPAGDSVYWNKVRGMRAANPINPLDTLPLVDLPPARGPTYSYSQSCAMTGPIYRYDGGLPSAVKFPPSFNRFWLVTDWNNGQIRAIKLNEDGVMEGTARPILRGLKPSLSGPLDFQQGPDGALYFLNFSCRANWSSGDSCTGIYRIEYRGSCQDPGLKPEMTSRLHGRAFDRISGPRVFRAAGRISIRAAGGYVLEIHAADGRRVRGLSVEGDRDFEISRLLSGSGAGLYWLQVRDGNGSHRERIAYLP
jgi:glucose/arabinose dehydrogenase